MASSDHSAAFGPLEGSKTALLTTFRDGGEAVGTPLSIALANGKVYFVTATDSGKARRLAGTARVTLAPCTVLGKVTGETVDGRARRLDPAERRTAAKGLLKPTGPLFWSLVTFRLIAGAKMELFEVVPADGPVSSGGQEPVTSRG
ncbi:MAG TPA: pyridoxamine 5'-phosphate oxidase family protein [Actinomycetota bacterium]|nr:pyridoxamine 5'-phosphate oxidase family protein [Actinomycetota bacterium]